jgi:hypothetical protein
VKRPDIYLIKWFDSQSDDGWVLFNSKKKISPMIIHSVGYLVDETSDYIRLSLSWGQNKNGNNPQFNGSIQIYKKCIVKRKKLS